MIKIFLNYFFFAVIVPFFNGSFVATGAKISQFDGKITLSYRVERIGLIGRIQLKARNQNVQHTFL